MGVSVRCGMTVAILLGLVSAARCQTAMPSSAPGLTLWTPDLATVMLIEATLTLPSRSHWAPGPLKSYARYYIGQFQDGHRVIYGDLLRGRLAREAPGIYLHSAPARTGGGCDQIQLWYDINAHRMLQIQCYGLG
jgi:hypothetical protein